MGIRVVIVDDNPHVTWAGRTYPVNATFQHFAAALLDLPGSPLVSITSCVPLRAAGTPPGGRPLDERIGVVGTAPFDGIAGYLRHLPSMLGANRSTLDRTLADADLVWIKVPASNAGLASAIAARHGMPRFVWVAGSAADVAAARFGTAGAGAVGVVTAVGARAVGAGYDLVGRLAAVGGQRIVVGEGIGSALAEREGIVASLVEPRELRDPDGDGLTGERRWPPATPARLAWAGRLTEGKGLEALLAAIAIEPGLTVDLLGAGPASGRLRRSAPAAAAASRISWAGHLAERSVYLDRLAAADAFVFPSPAEGFPKVVLDAFAVGLPVLATGAGALGELVPAGLIEPIERSEPGAILAAWSRLRDADPADVARRRQLGHDFAARHSRPAEAARLVDRWRGWWPELPWDR